MIWSWENLIILLRCDGCQLSVHNKFSKFSVAEIKRLSAKNRNLRCFCNACNLGLKEIPEKLLNKLPQAVENLEIQKT